MFLKRDVFPIFQANIRIVFEKCSLLYTKLVYKIPLSVFMRINFANEDQLLVLRNKISVARSGNHKARGIKIPLNIKILRTKRALAFIRFNLQRMRRELCFESVIHFNRHSSLRPGAHEWRGGGDKLFLRGLVMTDRHANCARLSVAP